MGARDWLVGLAVMTTGCGGMVSQRPAEQLPTPAPDAPKVVATSSVICDLTRQIAQTRVHLTCLVPPGVDAHTYQPTPANRQALETAQVVFYNGYNLEPAVEKLIAALPASVTRVPVGELAVPKPLMGIHAHPGHGHDHHHHGDEKKAQKVPDPHVFHTGVNAANMAKVIGDKLAQIYPAQAAAIQTKAGQVVSELQQIDQWIRQQVQTIPPRQRKLVTTHEALGYFTQAYGLELMGALQGISTQEQPSPARLAQLARDIKQAQVPTIFAEVSINPKLLNTVAQEAGVKIAATPLYTDGLGPPGSPAATVQGMLITNTCTVVQGLGGTCTPFNARQTPSKSS
ncbi:MAG: zinc ABC transporter substrate-binding protein [Gloeomargarita sp. SKYG116]|nr:zinc ABC transporter substrate-binding protein [Gloeomargarita sp. SKYG116]MDW8400201.1 zinc ABC transporter substrate-binding protein [Gloeomargarita sp. SKYGB_i_bin116]